jgi:hypothetical protein
MKKLVLAMLMVVMLATPCMAEVEPEGLFSIDHTEWSISPPMLGGLGSTPVWIDSIGCSAGIIYGHIQSSAPIYSRF